MIARLRSTWFSINASYWFFPALLAVVAFALATLLVHLDRLGAADWISAFKIIDPARPDGASNMLTVLAGSMIGVASTVFSITIAAVAYASGTYGPRLLTNFMEDRGNQLSLATFIGTFVYAITVLRSVRAADEAPLFYPPGAQDLSPGFVPQLSLVVAFLLMIVAVGVLVYFLHHVPSSIRINTVLETIGERLLGQIREEYPEEGDGCPVHPATPKGARVLADKTGYVRLIEFGQLEQLARHRETRTALLIRPGDFVYPGIPLACTDRENLDEAFIDDTRQALALGGSRTPEQDLEFSIDELVEIALRALSPGINDPFTAIAAVHWLGAATAELGQRDLSTQKWTPPDGDCLLTRTHNDFEHFVERGFGSARSGLGTNRLAALVGLEAMHQAAAMVHGERRVGLLMAEADRLMEQAAAHLAGPDLEDVRLRYQALNEQRRRQ